MISVKEAHKIGKEKCFDLLGYENVVLMKDTACAAYSPEFKDGIIQYFIGITDEPLPTDGKIHTEHTPYKYRAIVNVHEEDGSVDVIECIAPS